MSLEKKNFILNYKKGKPQILRKSLIADTETPFSSLLKINKGEKYSFLLESVEGGSKKGRYSLLGCDPDIIWNVQKGKDLFFLFKTSQRYDLPAGGQFSIAKIVSGVSAGNHNVESSTL